MVAKETTYTPAELSGEWDKVADRMELYPEFYTFIAEAVRVVKLPFSTSLADVGCGTGRMLELLSRQGYTGLTGVDISAEAVNLAKQRVPEANVFVYNLSEAPLPNKYNAIFLTEVIMYIPAPDAALENLHSSLVPGGYLFLSAPNKLAFWPWYHLAGLRHLLQRWPRLQHWFMWFTMPHEMRSDLPLDRAYSRNEVARFARQAGFEIVGQRGMRLLPMLRIPGLPFTETVISRLEKFARKIPVQWWYYRSMFICQKKAEPQ